MPDLLGALAAWVTDIVYAAGYFGIGALTAMENLLPPIPSELVLPLAGFLAGRGRFWLPAVILAATAGSLAGSLILYALGRWMGEDPLRRFIRGHGRYLFLDEGDLDWAAGWFDRHGDAAVFFGRLVPLIRSGISVPAGVERMPLWRFALYTTLGSALWNGLLTGFGWALGEQWELVQQFVAPMSYAVLAALAVLVVWFVWRRRQQHDTHA
jgi:membrane protein DedA with SNARE-associated domain